MKRICSTMLVSVLMFALCTISCSHVHTRDCGENGVNCDHDCYTVILRNGEHSPR